MLNVTYSMPGKGVVKAIDPSTLTYTDKERALNAVNLVREKRDGMIKGQTYADGSKQWRYLAPDNSEASPTVSLEVLFITSAHRSWIFDFKNTF